MQVKPEIERFAKIKVVGIGGAGGNVLNSMIDSQQIVGVEFIAINTDAQDLSVNKAAIKIPIGQEITHGLGAGADPAVGKRAAEESTELILQNLQGADMVFVTAGMGGGTGTGASPTIAQMAKKAGALTVGVVTKPFNFEGAQRMRNAEKGILELKKEVDALITIPNQKLLDIADENMSIIDAFKMSDSVLNQGVQGISDLIVMPGYINVDFADVRTIMKDAGTALMGIGIGTGEMRAEAAARAAIASPLLEQTIDGAKGILFNVTGGADMTMREVDRAANIIREIASEDANIIFGTTVDERLNGQIKITVIATGFDTHAEKDEFGFETVNAPRKVNLDEIRRFGSVGISGVTPAIKPIVGAGVVSPSVEPALPVVSHTLPNDVSGLPEIIPNNVENKGDVKKDPKDLYKPKDFDGDFDSKYDIPAFLRGK